MSIRLNASAVPASRLRSGAQPARTSNSEQHERDRGDERDDQTRAEPQPEALVGG